MNKKKKGKFIVKILFIVGIFITSFAIIFYFSGKFFFKSQMASNLSLKKDSPTLKQWANPISTVYRKYYFFDMKNSWRFLKGLDKKPILIEKGPYVYREDKKSVNIKYIDENTMTYSPETKLYFEPSLSVGNETDIITFLNIPATALIDRAIRNENTLSQNLNFGMIAINAILDYMNVDLFLKRSVGQLIRGYQDPILQFGKAALPKLITSDEFSILNGENDTIKENFTIMTGVDDINNLGKMVAWNGLKKLDLWETEEANKIKGMDSSLFLPFMNPSYSPNIFTSSLGKTIKFEFSKKANIDDYDTFEYLLSKDTFFNSANKGYCKDRCLGNGVHFVGPLSGDAPVYISQPHFMNAEEKFINSVTGLKPDNEKHNFRFNYEPNSGIPIKGIGRLQINFLLNGHKNIHLTKNIDTVLFPVFWIEVTFKHHPSTLKLLAEVQFFSKLITFIPLIFLIIGVVITLTSLTALMYRRINNVSLTDNSEKLNKIYKGKEYTGVTIEPENC